MTRTPLGAALLAISTVYADDSHPPAVDRARFEDALDRMNNALVGMGMAPALGAQATTPHTTSGTSEAAKPLRWREVKARLQTEGATPETIERARVGFFYKEIAPSVDPKYLEAVRADFDAHTKDRSPSQTNNTQAVLDRINSQILRESIGRSRARLQLEGEDVNPPSSDPDTSIRSEYDDALYPPDPDEDSATSPGMASVDSYLAQSKASIARMKLSYDRAIAIADKAIAESEARQHALERGYIPGSMEGYDTESPIEHADRAMGGYYTKSAARKAELAEMARGGDLTPTYIQPTYRGTSIPDYGRSGYVIQPNLDGGSTVYPTYPGTSVPNYMGQGYQIHR